MRLHRTRQLAFFGDLSGLANVDALAEYLAPLHKTEWVVYAKPLFGGPEAVLAYLSRYTHRIAISNHRLVSADADTVAFRWKDYRVKFGDRMKIMRLHTHEFIRRFLIHVLPDGFHRIRHYGLLASAARKTNIAKIRTLLGEKATAQDDAPTADVIPLTLREPCPDCGGQKRIIETFRRGSFHGLVIHRGGRPHDRKPVHPVHPKPVAAAMPEKPLCPQHPDRPHQQRKRPPDRVKSSGETPRRPT